jgi:hypothetical protein
MKSEPSGRKNQTKELQMSSPNRAIYRSMQLLGSQLIGHSESVQPGYFKNTEGATPGYGI